MPLSIADLPWLPESPADFAAKCRAIGLQREPQGPSIQHLAGFRLSPRESSLLARAIRRCREEELDLAPLSVFRLGVLASATFDLLLDCLPAAAARHGVALDLKSAPSAACLAARSRKRCWRKWRRKPQPEKCSG